TQSFAEAAFQFVIPRTFGASSTIDNACDSVDPTNGEKYFRAGPKTVIPVATVRAAKPSIQRFSNSLRFVERLTPVRRPTHLLKEF
ncbi:hypothetical protein PY650_36880, partial [Rhizobium calliandrae]|nr:hypothetical protein [Rhizobium calliandrae]